MRAGLVAIGLVIVAAAPARADVNIEKADAAFAEGQALKEQHKTDEACAKFKESLGYNPNAVGTMLNVAECEFKLGHIGTAYQLYIDARDRAQDAGLTPAISLANEQIAKLAADVPYLAVQIAEHTDDTKLAVNNQAVAIKPDGSASLPIDPGEVTVIVSQPGRVPFEKKLTVGKREHPVVAVDKLKLPVVNVNKGRKRIGQILTIGGAGVAATGLGIGVVAWISYKNNVSHCGPKQADGYHCPDSTDSSKAYYSNANDAVTLGSVGTWVGIGGLAVAGVGTYLWFFGPHDERLAFVPQLDPEHAGIVALGRF